MMEYQMANAVKKGTFGNFENVKILAQQLLKELYGDLEQFEGEQHITTMGGAQQSMLQQSYVKAPKYVCPDEFTSLKTIPDRLKFFADTVPNKEAVVFLNTVEPRFAVTFRELFENSKKAAIAFLDLGIKQDDYILVNIAPSPEWLYVVFGAMMAKIKPVCVSFTFKDGSDIVAILERLPNCPCIILDPGIDNEKWNILSKLLENVDPNGMVSSKQMPTLRYIFCHDYNNYMHELKSFKNLLNEVPINSDIQLPDINESDVAVLVQTSGSTGIPKAVVHTHKSIMRFAPVDKTGRVCSGNHTYYCDRPFLWLGGFPLGLFIGQTRVTVSEFCPPPDDRATFCINAIRDEKCQVMFGLPPVLHEMMKRKDECIKDWPLRSIITGGQPITAKLVSGLVDLCQYVVVLYGSTEGSACHADVLTVSSEIVDYSTGYLLDGYEAKLVDDDNDIVPIGSRGEIWIRSDAVFKEYVNDPERTRSVFTEDDWLKTGDVGRMLPDGALIVEGRKANTILSGGMNITPELLEHILLKCPGVDAAVIVPVPDDVMFQVLCACIKPHPGSDIDEVIVQEFCKEQHADKLGLFTVLPKYYMFLDKIPETSTGKISRPELTRMAKEKFTK